MTTIVLWLMIQVYPVVEPIKLTDSAQTCVILADKELLKNDDQILKCIPVEILLEKI